MHVFRADSNAFALAAGQDDASLSEGAQSSSVFATRNHGYREQAYDTVVDTFGLCSHADPVAVLQVSFLLVLLLPQGGESLIFQRKIAVPFPRVKLRHASLWSTDVFRVYCCSSRQLC